MLIDLVGDADNACDVGDDLADEGCTVSLVGVVGSVVFVWLVGNAGLKKPPISRP